MQTFVITSELEWERWRASWNVLANANPMLSMEWLQAWWHQFGCGHQLHIVAVSDGDRLLGFLPCYRHETRIHTQLRFLGSGRVSSDYLTAVVDETKATVAYAALINYLRESAQSGDLHEFESLNFEAIAHDDEWTVHLEKFANEAAYSFRNQSIVSSWAMSLPSTLNELLDSLRGRSIHRKAKKCLARIASGELAIRHLTAISDLQEGLQHLIRLHQARRQSVGDEGCFADPRFERFLREAMESMLSAGTACFTLCESSGTVIGVHLLLMGRDTVYMYQSGVDPHFMALEPGYALVTGSLQHAISNGYQQFDFLRGDEPYKSKWGANAKPLRRITLAPPTLKAQAIEAVHRNLSWLRSCYSELSFSSLRSK